MQNKIQIPHTSRYSVQIIAETGTHGSGKGEVAKYLVARGYKHYSARDYLREQIEKAGGSIEDRNAYHDMANHLRRLYGAGHVGYTLYQRAHKAGGNSVLESFYTTGEVNAIWDIVGHIGGAEHFTLISVDADVRIRYARVMARKSETDRVTFDEFIAKEERELHSPNAGEHNLRACMAMADIKLTNDGSLVEFLGKLAYEISEREKMVLG